MTERKKTWTVDQLLKAQPAIERLMGMSTNTFQGDPALPFDLARIYRQIEPEITIAHQRRVALMRECGAEEEGPSLIFRTLETQMKYQQKYEDQIGTVKRPLNIETISWGRFEAINLPMRVADLAFLDGLVLETDGKEGA